MKNLIFYYMVFVRLQQSTGLETGEFPELRVPE